MIHFLRNKLYRTTACHYSKRLFPVEELSTTHTAVTCPECIEELISMKERELQLLKDNYEKYKDRKPVILEITPYPRKRGPKPQPDNQLKLLEEE